MNQNILKNIIKFFVFLCISVVLFWLVYRDQDMGQIWDVLQHDVDYTWIIVAIVCGLASHLSRSMRWKLVCKSMGYNLNLANGFMGVMIGYFANTLIPRMGEFSRCGVVSKYEKIPFSKLLGTVVTERVVDLIILLSLTIVVFISQFKHIGIFLRQNPDVEAKFANLLNSWWIVGIGLCLVLIIILMWILLRRTKFKDKISSFVSGLKEGIVSVSKMEHKYLFVAHSLFIWLMFFLMMYVCFFSFDFTSNLSPMVGLAIFVAGSFGMVAPVQGGIGAWHFMVIAALVVYLPGVEDIETKAKTFALLTHGAMTMLYIVVGAICLVAMPLYNHFKK